MWCPFYWGRCMCGVRNLGLYVPPKDIEFEYCTGEHRRCPRFLQSKKRATLGLMDEVLVDEEKKAREPPGK